MLRAFVNAFKVPDLRKKILFTLFIIAVYRFGSHVPVPIVDISRLTAAFKSQGQGQSMLFTWQPPGRPPERLGAAAFVPAPDPLRDEPRNAIPSPRS